MTPTASGLLFCFAPIFGHILCRGGNAMAHSINRVAVIGSGTMGGALAAHFANAGIPVYLLDIVPNKLTPDEEKKGLTLQHPAVRNRIVNAGLDAVKKSKPAALFTPQTVERIT